MLLHYRLTQVTASLKKNFKNKLIVISNRPTIIRTNKTDIPNPTQL